MPVSQPSSKRSSKPHPCIHLVALIAMLAAALAIATPRSAAAAPAQLDLEFDGSDNAGTLNSFLATSLPGTSAPNGAATVNTSAPGSIQIVTTAGYLLPFGTGQDNALAYQYDSAGSYTLVIRHGHRRPRHHIRRVPKFRPKSRKSPDSPNRIQCCKPMIFAVPSQPMSVRSWKTR